MEHGPVLNYLNDGMVVEGQYRVGRNRGDFWETTYKFPVPVVIEDISYDQFPGRQKAFLAEDGE